MSQMQNKLNEIERLTKSLRTNYPTETNAFWVFLTRQSPAKHLVFKARNSSMLHYRLPLSASGASLSMLSKQLKAARAVMKS